MTAGCSGFFERSGYTPGQRRLLFYSTCVPVRLLIVAALFVAAWCFPVTTARTAVVLGTLALAASLYFAVNRGCRWWQPASSVVVAAAVVAVAAASLAAGADVVSPLFIGALLLAHVAFGALLSVKLSPWGS